MVILGHNGDSHDESIIEMVYHMLKSLGRNGVSHAESINEEKVLTLQL